MRSIRWIVCSLLIVLAGLGAAGSVLALFVHTQVNDTDSYVETVAPRWLPNLLSKRLSLIG